MLDIDHTASRDIEQLTAATAVDREGGLRIAKAERDCDLSIQPHPAADDVVVARASLDPRAAQALSDKVLDVRRRPADRIHSGVHPQA